MLKDGFIVPKLALNGWDKEMIKEILLDNSINRSFQEADLSDTGADIQPQNITD